MLEAADSASRDDLDELERPRRRSRARARRRARRHEARREVLRVGAARHPAADRARSARPREEPVRAGAPRHAREDDRRRSTTLGEDGWPSCCDASRTTCSPRRASAARRTASASRITYDQFREIMEGDGAFVYAGWNGDPAMRGAGEGGDQGDDPRAFPTRSSDPPKRRRTCLSDRRAGDSTRSCGQGVLTAGASRSGDGALALRGRAARRRSPTRSARRRTSTAPAAIRDQLRAAGRGARAACRTGSTTR